MSSNRLEKAVEVYAGILEDYPEDTEALLVLGDLYLAAKDYATAAKLYDYALSLDAENQEILSRLRLARAEDSDSEPEEVPTHPDAISRLLQRLTGSSKPISEDEIQRAANLLHSIIHSNDPANEVADHLDDIDSLLPALIELNIRQARFDGRQDLVEQLKDLQTNILLQQNLDPKKETAPETPPNPAPGLETSPRRDDLAKGVEVTASERFRGRVFMMVANHQRLSQRTIVLRDALQLQGCEVHVISEIRGGTLPKPDVIITSNPHQAPRLLESLAACSAVRIPIVLDLDDDFEHVPVSHPAYAQIGLGTMNSAKAYTASLLLSSMVTVPSQMLANHLKSAGYNARYAPDGWTRANPLWQRRPGFRPRVQIGWLGQAGLFDDIASVRRVIIRTLREFANTQLVIGGSRQVFQMFDAVPDDRRVFLPPVEVSDYPYLLDQVDILMLPLRNTPYNQSVSDRVLVEAGVKHIPWLASPMPAVTTWQAGGLVAETPEEWHTLLRHLVMDAELRMRLGDAGLSRAGSREAYALGKQWVHLLEEVIQTAKNWKKQG